MVTADERWTAASPHNSDFASETQKSFVTNVKIAPVLLWIVFFVCFFATSCTWSRLCPVDLVIKLTSTQEAFS